MVSSSLSSHPKQLKGVSPTIVTSVSNKPKSDYDCYGDIYVNSLISYIYGYLLIVVSLSSKEHLTNYMSVLSMYSKINFRHTHTHTSNFVLISILKLARLNVTQ